MKCCKKLSSSRHSAGVGSVGINRQKKRPKSYLEPKKLFLAKNFWTPKQNAFL